MEKDVDRLRMEAIQREEKVREIETDLAQLRKYKEMNDVKVGFILNVKFHKFCLN